MRRVMPIDRQGFTLIEVLIGLVGVVVLAVAATAFLFSTLGQRDQAIGESLAAEQAESVMAVVGTVVRAAGSIEVLDGGKRLETSREDECWTFLWDEVEEKIGFGRSEGIDCSPPAEASRRLTAEKVAVERVNFSLVAPDDTSRTLRLEMDIEVSRPLWQTSQSFDQMFVNVVDVYMEEE